MTVPDSRPQPDARALGRWLDANGAPGAGEEPVLEQLAGGSQNTDPLLDLAWCLLGYDGGLATDDIDYYLVLANWKLGIVLEKTYAAGVRTGGVDPKITEAFGPMILQLIATAAKLTRSLPTKR